jgi:hypothetical protein
MRSFVVLAIWSSACVLPAASNSASVSAGDASATPSGAANPASSGSPAWADSDRFFSARCGDLDGAFKIKVKCSLDHVSFDKAQRGPDDHPSQSPHDECGTGALYSITSPNIAVHCSEDSSCGPHFRAAVKQIVCRADIENHLTLEGGTLVIFVNEKAGESPDAWTHSELDRLFTFSKQ